jgi:O-antigen/teichoic acid export membrane protein
MNLGTGGLILVLNVAFVPAMLHSFGMELYGVLSVTWMVLSHLQWLDLGFSAACAKYVARDLARGMEAEAGRWAWAAVTVQAIVGTVAALALWLSAPYLAELLKVDPARREMVVLALRMFALVVPLDLSAKSMTGVLEATQRFDWINGLNVAGALWTFSTYAVGIMRGGDFRAVVYGLVAFRVVNLLGTLYAACRVLPSMLDREAFATRLAIRGSRLREMFRFGGWVSVSSGIGPLIFFCDRWVISTLRGVALLPLYTVPLQMLVSLQIIPASGSATLFPAFSVLEASTEWDRLQRLLVRAHRLLLLLLIPVLFTLFYWAPEILRLWISPEFAQEATIPFRILLAGFSVGLFAPFSGALLQGAGRPDVLSKVYLAEFPVNVLMTVLLVKHFGIVGAAVTYSVRTVVETVILWVCIHRVFPLERWGLLRGVLHRLAPVGLAVGALFILLPEPRIDSPVAVLLSGVALVVYAIVAFFHLLDDADRMLLRGLGRRTPVHVSAEGSTAG